MKKTLDRIIESNDEIYINDTFYDDLSQIIIMNKQNIGIQDGHTYCVCKKCKRKISQKLIKKEYLASQLKNITKINHRKTSLSKNEVIKEIISRIDNNDLRVFYFKGFVYIRASELKKILFGHNSYGEAGETYVLDEMFGIKETTNMRLHFYCSSVKYLNEHFFVIEESHFQGGIPLEKRIRPLLYNNPEINNDWRNEILNIIKESINNIELDVFIFKGKVYVEKESMRKILGGKYIINTNDIIKQMFEIEIKEIVIYYNKKDTILKSGEYFIFDEYQFGFIEPKEMWTCYDKNEKDIDQINNTKHVIQTTKQIIKMTIPPIIYMLFLITVFYMGWEYGKQNSIERKELNILELKTKIHPLKR